MYAGINSKKGPCLRHPSFETYKPASSRSRTAPSRPDRKRKETKAPSPEAKRNNNLAVNHQPNMPLIIPNVSSTAATAETTHEWSSLLVGKVLTEDEHSDTVGPRSVD